MWGQLLTRWLLMLHVGLEGEVAGGGWYVWGVCVSHMVCIRSRQMLEARVVQQQQQRLQVLQGLWRAQRSSVLL